MDDDQAAQIDEFILNEQILLAVRQHRAVTGSELSEAKAYVDAREEILRKDQPPQLKTPPPAMDSDVHHQLTELEDADLGEIRSICSQLEEVLYGLNYQVTIEVAGRNYSGNDLPIKEFMNIVYPEAEAHLTSVSKVRPTTMRTEFIESLNSEGDSGAGPQFTPVRLERMNTQLLPSFFGHLDRLMPPESTNMYSYNSDVGLPGYYTFWFKAFVLQNSVAQKILIVSAVASD